MGAAGEIRWTLVMPLKFSTRSLQLKRIIRWDFSICAIRGMRGVFVLLPIVAPKAASS
jgi:hypothetical protein